MIFNGKIASFWQKWAMMLVLDHIAIAAQTLEAGRTYVEETLGVSLLPGGQHARYGTHNMLLGLEDGLYLEVIAIDPSVVPPLVPRWFDLDRFSGPPRIGNWICRSDDIDATIEVLPDLGPAVSMARGDFRWMMGVPETGILPFDNCAPAVLQWQGAMPGSRFTPTGIRLIQLTVSHPLAKALEADLSGHLRDDRVRFEVGALGFHAEFDTPRGTVSLS